MLTPTYTTDLNLKKIKFVLNIGNNLLSKKTTMLALWFFVYTDLSVKKIIYKPAYYS